MVAFVDFLFFFDFLQSDEGIMAELNDSKVNMRQNDFCTIVKIVICEM